MSTARDDAVRAAVAFAQDTDDWEAALDAFRQVLGEAEAEARRGRAERPFAAPMAVERAFGQVLAVAHGLSALVERVAEAFDEDTWADFLRDERQNVTTARVVTQEGTDGPGGYPTPHHETAGDPDDYEEDSACDCGADPRGGDPECFCTAPPSDLIEHDLTVADVDDEGHEVPGSRVRVCPAPNRYVEFAQALLAKAHRT